MKALFLLPFFLVSFFARAESVSKLHVKSELVAEHISNQPGTEAWIGLRLNHEKQWHTYWKFPGDSGLPTKVKWELPKGWEISEIYWPIPERILLLPIVNYGYEKEILLGFKVKIPVGEKPGNYDLKAKASWLVCKEECVPEKADLNIQVKVDNAPSKRNPWARLFDTLRAEQPIAFPANAQISIVDSRADEICFVLDEAATEFVGNIKKLDFFASAPQLIYDPSPPEMEVMEGEIRLCQKKADPFRADATRFTGILVEGTSHKKAFEIDLPISQKNSALSAAATTSSSTPTSPINEGSISLMVFAFLGGLLLNLMPCVFPVLGIKVMSLIKQSGGDRWEVAKHGQAYSWGVIISFWLLTGLLLLLRKAGNSIGWGFQLQEPLFVIALILIFSLMTLNLLGFFEFSARWMGMGSSLAQKEGIEGSFFTGVLAVVVATPCTAPFMGVAIGAALSKPAWVIFSVFTALGFGLAFPFFLLSFFPSAVQMLPRPGMWMVRLKEFFAFPMAASLVWLFWVLSKQAGSYEHAVLILGISISLLFVGLVWIKTTTNFFKALSLLLVIFSFYLLWPNKGTANVTSEWQPYSEEKIQELQKSARPIFVDFTAAWCITCQVNKKTVLDREEMLQFFKKNNVALLEADWTNNDPKITRALEKYGRIGVPLYLSFPEGEKSPKILPQILTKEIVENSLLKP